jgi:UDP-MurNAc hydroxylase
MVVARAWTQPLMPIRVTYLYSACVRIDTPDVRVLCDPWFTDGAYDGSWFQFPRLLRPIEAIGPVDLIYVSHIHPDHYDPTFLRAYLDRHPKAELIIAPFAHEHLERKMVADGFRPTVAGHRSIGQTSLHLVPHEQPEDPDPSDIDSALVVRLGDQSVVNMNDNLYDERFVALIRELCPRPTIALLGYTGAGPYPQTYYDEPGCLSVLAEAKKQEFFERYRKMRRALEPRVVIPFAGKYVLGGRLASMNEHRGVADAVEVLAFDPNAVVLDDGGDASIDTASLVPTRTRTRPYPEAAVRDFVASLRGQPMAYETFMPQASAALLPIQRIAKKAYANALRSSRCREDHLHCFALPGGWLVVNANAERPSFAMHDDVSTLTPRSEIHIDPRYLFGLMTGVFHWDNAAIGSQLRVRRHPDVFDRSAQRFLNFFCV